ncbi:MAG: hypothetical protein PF517_11150 [Salinivirgaceae bacterium]|nr:hypothetical protein [Salinivirgaceae bacterium]
MIGNISDWQGFGGNSKSEEPPNIGKFISKIEVLTNRNLMQGLIGGATEQWIGKAQNSTQYHKVNQTGHDESLWPMPANI